MVDLAVQCLQIIDPRPWRIAKQAGMIIVGVGLCFHMSWATAAFTYVVYWLAHQEQQRLQPAIDYMIQVITATTITSPPHP